MCTSDKIKIVPILQSKVLQSLQQYSAQRSLGPDKQPVTWQACNSSVEFFKIHWTYNTDRRNTGQDGTEHSLQKRDDVGSIQLKISNEIQPRNGRLVSSAGEIKSGQGLPHYPTRVLFD